MNNGIGTHLGRYEIVAEIGRGAMGLVYQAHDPKIDRLVAIKTISLQTQEIEEEHEFRERFFLEARAAGRLVHPGIVTIFDVGEDVESHEPYIVMEFVTGQPLNRILSGENRKLPLGPVLQITQEIAEALNYAHSQNVVHRDIKPANILMTLDGRVKIADFGIAKVSHGLMTLPGQVLGSPAYMAPEQLSGDGADARSDLFSVGVILYSMLTGFRPFQGNSAATVSFKVVNRDPLPVTSFDSEFPAELDRLVSRAIAKDPVQRYQSGLEMAQDIQRLRERYNLIEQTAAKLECVTNPAENTRIIKKPVRFVTPSVRSTESSTQAQTPRPRSTESSTQAQTPRPRSTESSMQAQTPRPRGSQTSKQAASSMGPDPIPQLPAASQRRVQLKAGLMPKEILFTGASALLVALLLILFETIHLRKSVHSSIQQPNVAAKASGNQASGPATMDAVAEQPVTSGEAQIDMDVLNPKKPARAASSAEAKAKSSRAKKPAPLPAQPILASSTAPVKTPAPAQPAKPVPQADTATLQIQIEYQFAEVEASVWLDNQQVYSQKLLAEPKKHGILFKKVEGRQHSNVAVPAGQHTLHVRVVSGPDQYDQSQDISGNFVSNSENVLKITCEKNAEPMQVTLQ